jgi:hypothetical protein
LLAAHNISFCRCREKLAHQLLLSKLCTLIYLCYNAAACYAHTLKCLQYTAAGRLSSRCHRCCLKVAAAVKHATALCVESVACRTMTTTCCLALPSLALPAMCGRSLCQQSRCDRQHAVEV